jgi:hypothetical protein
MSRSGCMLAAGLLAVVGCFSGKSGGQSSNLPRVASPARTEADRYRRKQQEADARQERKRCREIVEGRRYRCWLAGAYPEHEDKQLKLLESPDGMTYNEEEGLLRWEPCAWGSRNGTSLVGDHLVRFAAVDEEGNEDRREFRVRVTPNPGEVQTDGLDKLEIELLEGKKKSWLKDVWFLSSDATERQLSVASSVEPADGGLLVKLARNGPWAVRFCSQETYVLDLEAVKPGKYLVQIPVLLDRVERARNTLQVEVHSLHPPMKVDDVSIYPELLEADRPEDVKFWIRLSGEVSAETLVSVHETDRDGKWLVRQSPICQAYDRGDCTGDQDGDRHFCCVASLTSKAGQPRFFTAVARDPTMKKEASSGPFKLWVTTHSRDSSCSCTSSIMYPDTNGPGKVCASSLIVVFAPEVSDADMEAAVAKIGGNLAGSIVDATEWCVNIPAAESGSALDALVKQLETENPGVVLSVTPNLLLDLF